MKKIMIAALMSMAAPLYSNVDIALGLIRHNSNEMIPLGTIENLDTTTSRITSVPPVFVALELVAQDENAATVRIAVTTNKEGQQSEVYGEQVNVVAPETATIEYGKVCPIFGSANTEGESSVIVMAVRPK